MFKLLRKVLIGLLLAVVGAVGYHYLSNPLYQRQLVQKAEEVKEDLGEDKKRAAWSGTAVVVEVVKGDKLRINTEASQRALVRLAGIDAPEMPVKHRHPGQPLAEESRQHLANLVLNKAVDLAILGTDAAKEPLALVTIDGALVNASMVEAGFAEVISETADRIPARQRHVLENAERSAKEKRLGIWGLTNYVRPVEFRIRQH